MTPLKKGDKAPNFFAKDQDGTSHSLSDYKGKKLVGVSVAKDLNYVPEGFVEKYMKDRNFISTIIHLE